MPRKKSPLPKYVSEERDPKTGAVYVYFRRRGQPKVRMREKPYTDEFNSHYHRLLRGEEAAPQPRQVGGDGTLGWLCRDYFASAEFRALDERTRRVRKNIVEAMLDEGSDSGGKTGSKIEMLPLDRLTGKHVRALRDRRATNDAGVSTPEAANARVKALRQILAHGVAIEALHQNVARDIPYLRSGTEGFHSWTVAEVEQFEETHPIGTKARLAMALMLYTAQRRSDIIQFGRQHVRAGWLRFTQFKNRNRKPVTLEIPVFPPLQRIIDASPCGDLTFLVTEFGKPFTAAGFGNRFRKWCDQAELPQCSAHGLRKAAAARLAEAGASEKQIMAITGHTTSKEVVRYTRGAEQKRLAEQAMDLLDDDPD